MREIAVQADDFDIQRKSTLPSRKRYIPIKFTDYRIFAGEDGHEDDDSFTGDDDLPQKKRVKPRRVDKVAKRPRGRPRCSEWADEQVISLTKGQPSDTDQGANKLIITRVSNGFKCGVCERIFSLRGNAKAHLITHTNERPFPCSFDGCNVRLRTRMSLHKHQLSRHLGVKLFECTECNQRFSSNASLREHMARHTGDKPLVCAMCGTKFRQMCVLRRHMTTHSKEKPFKCSVCGRSFSIKVYLQSHMKSHTGEKPFSCDVCHKKFAHLSDVNRHKITHSGEKPYPCSVCGKRYGDSSSRRRHEKKAHEGPKVACKLCNQQFSRPRNLHVHLLRQHNMQEVKLGAPQPLDPALAIVHEKVSPIPESERTVKTEVIEDDSEHSSEPPHIEIDVTSIGAQDGTNDDAPSQTEWAYAILGSTNDTSFLQLQNGKPLGLSPSSTFTVVQGVESLPILQKLDVSSLPASDHRVDLSNLETENLRQEELAPASDTECSQDIKVILTDDLSSNDAVTTMLLSFGKPQEEDKEPALSDSKYVYHPDLSSQDYYNWLSAFAEECKQCGVPFEKENFTRISHVYKTLTDFMACPSGVICDKTNFQVLMTITQDLAEVTNKHLAYMLNSLD